MKPNRDQSRPPCGGFTILELFLVIAIVAIVIGVAAQLRSPAARPAHALEVVARMAEVARTDALATGLPTRVALCVDPDAGPRYLRYVVALADADGDPATAGWRISDRGRTLPQGTIFWPDFSTPVGPENTMVLDPDSPGSVQDGTGGSEFIYIAFNGIGEPEARGVQWVFARAVEDDSGAPPLVPSPLDRDGFILRQTGRLAVFESPEDISIP